MTTAESQGQSLSVYEVLVRRKLVALVTFAVVIAATLSFVLIYHFKYGALAHVLLINDSSRDPSIGATDMPTIVTGSTVLLEVRRQLNLPDSINDLRKAVNARVAPKSSLMTITVQEHDQAKAIELSNSLAETFSRLYWSLASSRYDEVTRRLNSDVAAVRQHLNLVERRLEEASSGQSYVGSQASLDASAARLADLQESRGNAFAQYTTDDANLQNDLAAPSKTAKIVRFEILRNNSNYAQTESLVGKDVAQYTTTRSGVTSIYPGIEGFKDKIDKEADALRVLRGNALNGADAYSPSQAGQIVQTARDTAAVEGDRVKLEALDTQIAALKQQLSHPAGDAPSLGALRAERDAAEGQLQALSLAQSNAQASSDEARSLGQVVVVDRATEARPILVGPTLVMALGFVAAVMFAVGAAYLTELLVPRLIGPTDVENVYGRPILATLRAR